VQLADKAFANGLEKHGAENGDNSDNQIHYQLILVGRGNTVTEFDEELFVQEVNLQRVTANPDKECG